MIRTTWLTSPSNVNELRMSRRSVRSRDGWNRASALVLAGDHHDHLITAELLEGVGRLGLLVEPVEAEDVVVDGQHLDRGEAGLGREALDSGNAQYGSCGC